MIFVDTNVFMYAVGRSHPLREEARRFFEQSLVEETMQLCSSAEVLQELLHAYLPVGRVATLDAALTLANERTKQIWPIEVADVTLARALITDFPHLGARDLLHMACCRRRGVNRVMTFDRGLASAFSSG